MVKDPLEAIAFIGFDCDCFGIQSLDIGIMCLNFRKAYPSYILAVFDTVFSEFCEKSGVEE